MRTPACVIPLARGRVPRAGVCGLQDAEYEAAGATLVATGDAFASDIVLKVQPPNADTEVGLFKKGGRLISYINPAVNGDLVEKLKMQDMTVVGAPAAASAFKPVFCSYRGVDWPWTSCPGP